MKKLQPKIFIDNEISLATGYTLSTGYSIGQTIHFNDTGNEYYHKLDGVWVSNTTIISPVFTNSTSDITLDCVNDVQYDTNNGSTGETGATISFSNLPETSCEKLLIVNNERSEPFTLILPEDFTSGGTDYSIKKMLENPIIPIGGSAELRMLFLKNMSINASTSLHPRWDDSGDALIYGTDRFGLNIKPSGVRTISGSGGGEYEAIGMTEYIRTIDNGLYQFDNTTSSIFQLNYGGDDNKRYGTSIRVVRNATTEELDLSDGTAIPNAFPDNDGVLYDAVKIGNQAWITKNLATTKYFDGSDIPTNLSNEDWIIDTQGAMAVYGKANGTYVPTDELTTEALMVAAYGRLYNWYSLDRLTQNLVPIKTPKYGRLYNWYAATDVRNIAPVGWHVPSQSEWQTLVDFCGGNSIAGGELKETGTTHWQTSVGATDIYGFKAIGGGWAFNYSSFTRINEQAGFQTTTSLSESGSCAASLWHNDTNVTLGPLGYKSTGLSIRLIKDNSINEGDVIIDDDTYHAVTIGTQVWLQQNLTVTHYRNGDPILSDFSGTVGAVTVYNNDEANVYDIITPEVNLDDFHIPTDAEWIQLTDYLTTTDYPDITSDNVGDVLKSTRQVDSPYTINHREIRIRGNVTI